MLIKYYETEIDNVYNKTYDIFKKAKASICENNMYNAYLNESAISNVIPGWDEGTLDFGAYKQDEFAVLFVDMRNSTQRAKIYGAETTFLTMYAYLPAMIEMSRIYEGQVTDIAGDGVMVLWNKRNLNLLDVARKAVLCGLSMLQVLDRVTNKILRENSLPLVDIGVGVSCGDVIVTKIGFANSTYDVKAFGDCINEASKMSKGINEVRVSNEIKGMWDDEYFIKIDFNEIGGENCYLVSER